MATEENESDALMSGKVEQFKIEEIEITKDTSCGFGPCRGPLLQKFATKKMYMILYGVLGMFNTAAWAYFHGTITTMEKRFKMPSRVSGMIVTGSDFSGFFTSILLSYWAGQGHRPRWVFFGSCTYILQMVIATLPHLIYGAGHDALLLTQEYGAGTNSSAFSGVGTDQKSLCNGGGDQCTEDEGSFIQPAILFIGYIIGGIGGGLFYTVGVSYIDDNVDKSESPFLISVTYCTKMVGVAVGFALASSSLQLYVSPGLTPTITMDDPRWIGAWWLGWVVLSTSSLMFAIPLGMFPKILPEAALKQSLNDKEQKALPEKVQPSLKDMFATIKRLFMNKIYFFNNFAAILYCLGDDPYWIFLAKYIETQYGQNASVANFVTGSIGLVCTATGILISGFTISKIKPRGRTLAAYNVGVGLLTIAGLIAYVFIGCAESVTLRSSLISPEGYNSTTSCNLACDCEYTSYSPVCSQNNETFISACHAGCKSFEERDGEKVFFDCGCVETPTGPGFVKPGNCPVNCKTPFYSFVVIICILKFVGASGVPSNFLVGIRAIEERDKSVAMGLTLTLMGLLAFTPGPILFGYILDTTCLVWGKTCTGTGNCWLYDGQNLAYTLNLTAACFVSLGTLFDVGVWYYAKNLKVFD